MKQNDFWLKTLLFSFVFEEKEESKENKRFIKNYCYTLFWSSYYYCINKAPSPSVFECHHYHHHAHCHHLYGRLFCWLDDTQCWLISLLATKLTSYNLFDWLNFSIVTACYHILLCSFIHFTYWILIRNLKTPINCVLF